MRIILLGLALLLSSCSFSSEKTLLNEALLLYFDNDIPAHQRVEYDLNSDGINEALIYIRDPSACGSAGCTLLVFKGVENGYRFLSRTTITQLPLSVIESENSGWKNLIVHAKGMGFVVLEGSDKGYPLNPSLQPLAEELEMKASRELLNY